jgi:hypothetical protein
LVFCECKTLEKSGAETWKDVSSQFARLIGVAERCKASLAVLAAMADAFPEGVIDEIRKSSGIPTLFLSRSDLESGVRMVSEGDSASPLSLNKLLPIPFPEQRVKKTGKDRIISTGWGTVTSL